jgi:3-methyladenine DNA glycosylase AlkD
MDIISHLHHQFTQEQNPLRAQGQKAYMKGHFEFLGLSKPQRSLIQKALFKKTAITSEEELAGALKTLWNLPHREFQYVALELAIFFKKLWTPHLLPTIEMLICEKSWWDTVDTLAARIVGPLAQKHPELLTSIDKYIYSDNMWLRRTALIYQLSYKHETNKEKLFSYCQITMSEQEFFIRKAIGWALRQYSKVQAHEVRKFIDEHRSSLSKLSYAEASKYC